MMREKRTEISAAHRRAASLNDSRDASQLAWRAVAWGLAIVLALQVWRPYFFLADDNLHGWLPVVTGIGRNILRGASPFYEPTLLGGLDLLRDPGALCLWNPFVLALSLLSQTPLRLAVVDLFVAAHLLLAAFATSHLLALWRTRFGLELSDRRLTFLAVSYAFSAFSIIVCSSWNTFAPNIAAAPLALLGMFHASRRVGTALVAASTLLCILVGHLSPFLWAASSLSLFALVWAWAAPHAGTGGSAGGRWEVLGRWMAGSALGVALCSPLLALALSGFANTARDSSFGTRDVLWMSVPAPTLALSWLVGSLSVLSDTGQPLLLMQLSSGASHAIAAAIAAPFILLSVLDPAARSRRWDRRDTLFAAMVLATVLLIARPPWLQSIIENVPLLRSLRFPFREIWLAHLWGHAWAAWRAGSLSTREARGCAAVGFTVMAFSLLAWPPPMFLNMNRGRQWVVSGRADAFWSEVRPLLPPGSRILPIATREQWRASHSRLALPLLDAFNFPALFEVPSRSGYIIKGLERGHIWRSELDSLAGLHSPREGEAALRRDPNVVLVFQTSLDPPVVVFRGRHFRHTVRPRLP
jgi:hypothetical protein